MLSYVFLQGRALSRAKSRRNLDYMDVLHALEEQGISIRVASPKLVMEEVGGCDTRHTYDACNDLIRSHVLI